MVELFGLPGSGKSTLCKKMIDKGMKDEMYRYKTIFFYKIFFHIVIAFPFICPNYNKMFKKIALVFKNRNLEIKKIRNKYIYSVKAITYIKYMAFVCYIEKKKSQNSIFDEGIVHYCMALHSEFGIELEILDELSTMLVKENSVVPIGLNVSIEECINRIEIRNRKSTGIDFLKKDVLTNLLKDYKKAFDFFSLKYKVLNDDEMEEYNLYEV